MTEDEEDEVEYRAHLEAWNEHLARYAMPTCRWLKRQNVSPSREESLGSSSLQTEL
ncbi:hypothetical protein [Cryobacterium algoricola]|uniref:hypothetical protein n=1 Tax=Cryobacterium algoricola TaxID=1259183 RepID=UPI00141AE76F|nr:hypothetical protein [Cryobacterium algoricola]